ncbi:growth-regulating factor 9 isoform X2 [Cajanus cajan]|uniref:growth-regulating factor 9 isoform X2 n=1 Tax=Cajanus cajan TaxID=3821 RepID=UPI00098D7CA5|nr:growth-regulating factor 9 isoform X2 [Cajanus cajan]
MEAKPLRIVPSSHNTSGGGPQKKIDMGHAMEDGGVVHQRKRVVMVKEEKENSCCSTVGLLLGVDAHSAPQPQVITEAQRRELHHQVFIFNHLAYKPSPPHHLVQFPSNMPEYSFLGYDHGNMLDQEPHRCRRTDGKKWRCGKNVVPGQKYCERHMHRGRNRSRKPVETSQANSCLTTKPSNKSHTINKPASRTQFQISNPKRKAIQPYDTPSSATPRSLRVANCSSANNRSKNIVRYAEYLTPISSASMACSGSTLATAVAPKVVATFSTVAVAAVASDNKSCLKICQKDDQSKSCISNNISVRSGGKGSIVGDTNGISTGIGFSPRSVLQACNPSYLNDRTNMEPAPGRCRRTDGKKWQCKSAVLPGQKYCATHMHRGAKKRFANVKPAATTTCSGVTIARLPHSSATTNVQKAHCAIPNTNLSMSVPASAPFRQCIEKSPSSSDTDTTISDTLNECSYASF